MPGFTPGEQTGVFDLVDNTVNKVGTALTKTETTIKQGE